MKKIIYIILSLLLILTGCKKTEKHPAAQTNAVETVHVEIAAVSPTPTAAIRDTPAPSSPNENSFVPAVTETPEEEPSVEPDATATAEPSAEPSSTPAPTERYAAGEGIETVAWMSDTQHYANYVAKKLPNIYPVMTGFLRDKAEEMHLVYVVHTGDLVHENKSLDNWKVAREAMDMLNGIPTGVLAGNHDMNPAKGGYTNYKKFFGKKQYDGQACYGESFEDNRGHYDLITICGREYIFVYMSHDPDDKAIQFMVDSFQKYPDRVGILCLHEFMTTEGTISKTGNMLRDKVVAKCSNVYMVLCGHRYGFYTLEDAFDDDGDGVKERTVYEMMMNYQAAGKVGGGGYLRLMQFDEENHEIRCINYSPYYDDYDWLDDPTHREKHYEMDEKSESFILKMPWA